uniref:Uncharacterized protein n=1 Tax=Oryza brachyantha TaxID=4533 RepID=J3M058_ORYBR
TTKIDFDHTSYRRFLLKLASQQPTSGSDQVRMWLTAMCRLCTIYVYILCL